MSSNFFTKSNGQEAQVKDTAGDAGFAPLPNRTTVQAVVEGANWKTSAQDNIDFINLKVRVTDGDYQNRVLFAKLHVMAADDKKRDKAIDMFVLLDDIAGAGIHDSRAYPTDEVLTELLGIEAAFTFGLYKPNPDEEGFNYLQQIKRLGTAKAAPASTKTEPAAAPAKPKSRF